MVDLGVSTCSIRTGTEIDPEQRQSCLPTKGVCMQQDCFCCESILVSLLTCKTLEVVFDTSEQSCPNLATCKIILENFLTLSRLHRQTVSSPPSLDS